MFQQDVHFAGGREQGARPYQQDFYGFADPEELGGSENLLLTIADGMGGHAAGDTASREAVEAYFEAFYNQPPETEDRARMVDAMVTANQHLATLIQENAELEGMGTTFLSLLIRKNTLRWVSVGDSPLFLFRDQQLQQLNEEHSMRPILAGKVAAGELTEEEARQHPERNHLLAALTGGEIEALDAPEETTPLLPEDIILAATDGILTLSENRISRKLNVYWEDTARSVVDRLLADVLGRRKERQDNITAAVIRLPDE